MACINDPHNNKYLRKFFKSLQTTSFKKYNENIAKAILILLSKPNLLRPIQLSYAIFSLLKKHPKIIDILNNFHKLNEEPYQENIIEKIKDIELLRKYIELAPITDIQFETIMSRLRSLIIKKQLKNYSTDLNLTTSLSIQCFVNEYVFYESEEDTSNILELEKKIEKEFESQEKLYINNIIALSLFRPISKYKWVEKIDSKNLDDRIKKLFKIQIEEVFKEATISKSIKKIKIISNDVSKLVRNQYEENPYPRWIKTGFPEKSISLKDLNESLSLQKNKNKYQNKKITKVLIAGCGTGQQSIVSSKRYKNSQITAIDLSLKSLSYAIRKTKEYGINNINYLHGDILDLETLNGKFDIIESAGVLHHMDDPIKGWKKLIDKLAPNGLMMIGLYSKIAREDINTVRSNISKDNIPSTQNGIRMFRALKINNWLINNPSITVSRDFFTLSECRDLFFHVKEHSFDLLQIKEILGNLNLKFLGFVSYAKLRSFTKDYPERSSLYSLDLWHEFELNNRSAFSGMYQFWVKKIISEN